MHEWMSSRCVPIGEVSLAPDVDGRDVAQELQDDAVSHGDDGSGDSSDGVASGADELDSATRVALDVALKGLGSRAQATDEERKELDRLASRAGACPRAKREARPPPLVYAATNSQEKAMPEKRFRSSYGETVEYSDPKTGERDEDL